jgi:hypothetical protein
MLQNLITESTRGMVWKVTWMEQSLDSIWNKTGEKSRGLQSDNRSYEMSGGLSWMVGKFNNIIVEFFLAPPIISQVVKAHQ